MCGICGIVALQPYQEPEACALRRMTRALAHRGPDQSGAYENPGIALGVQRLRVVDLRTGDQPIHNERRTVWTVLNGEIYNSPALRQALVRQGHVFYTETDTEVLVHLYETYGPDHVRYLNGMFAYALWDEEERVAMVVRDPFGVKPLYYTVQQGQLLFASEIKSLLQHPAVSVTIDKVALDMLLTLRYCPGTRTLFDGIYKLLPGHWLRCGEDTPVTIERYWQLTYPRPGGTERSEREYAEELHALLDDSVRDCLLSDVPIGAFLSGGLDSSSAVAMMRRHVSGALKTYAVGFSEAPRLDETDYSNLVARELETEHRVIDCNIQSTRLLPHLIWACDEPLADPIIIPTYLLAEAARCEVTVVVTGEGADELFGGYNRFTWERLIAFYQAAPQAVTRSWDSYLKANGYDPVPEQIERMQLWDLPAATRYLAWQTVFTQQERQALYTQGFQPHTHTQEIDRLLSEVTHTDLINQVLHLDCATRLPELMLARTDRMTMAVSLEGRVPFLDRTIAEFASHLPSHLKIRGMTEKYVLKAAMRNHLPADITERPKQGLRVPFGHWVRQGMPTIVRLLATLGRREIFRTEVLESLVNAHFKGIADYTNHLWALVSFELWCQIYLDRSSASDIEFDLSPSARCRGIEGASCPSRSLH